MRKIQLNFVKEYADYRLFQDSDGEYYAIRDAEPVFCLVGTTEEIVVDKAKRALALYEGGE